MTPPTLAVSSVSDLPLPPAPTTPTCKRLLRFWPRTRNGPLRTVALVARVEYLMNWRRLKDVAVPRGEKGLGMEAMSTAGRRGLTRRILRWDHEGGEGALLRAVYLRSAQAQFR